MRNDWINLETHYIASSDVRQRKALGQIFTPLRIARCMTRWITTKFSRGRVLDPALGLGIFFRCLWDLYPVNDPLEHGDTVVTDSNTTICQKARKQLHPPLHHCKTSHEISEASFPYLLEGYEIDSQVATLAQEYFTQQGIPLHCQREDFLMAELEPIYDGIICNPPYIHFQEYSHSLALIQKFNQQYQMELNGFSNLYALFLIKALHLLQPGGRAAFLLPSECLNADYGTSLKSLLVESRVLSKLIIFDPSIQVFPGFLTTSAIFLLEQGWDGEVEMFTVNQWSELDVVEEILYGTAPESPKVQRKHYTFGQLDPQVKWRYYYGDLKINLHLQQRTHLTPLHTFANVRRGIATGANPFFTLSDDERKQHQIAMEYLTPCLTKASQVQYHIFRDGEWNELVKEGRKVFLLNLTGKTLDASVQEYIRWGEEQGYHTGYLTRHRQPWYSMEPMAPADLWVKTFGRNRAVFVENHTAALHLTCFHGIYLNTLGQQYRKVMVLYLITDFAREIFEGQKREYGSGLGKFEPNDIRNAYLLDLREIIEADLEILEQLYEQYLTVYHLPEDATAEIRAEAERIFVKYW